MLNDQADSSATEEYFDRLEVPEYELGKREPPQIFPQYKGTGNNSLVHSFHRDVLWALVQTFFSDQAEAEEIGSWTCYNKTLNESIVEYLPTIPQPPDYDVCKKIIDDL